MSAPLLLDQVAHIKAFHIHAHKQTHTCSAALVNILLSPSFTSAEKGQFLALDLGGSQFKVLQVKVREGMGIRRGGVELEEKTYPIPGELLVGKGAEVRG